MSHLFRRRNPAMRQRDRCALDHVSYLASQRSVYRCHVRRSSKLDGPAAGKRDGTTGSISRSAFPPRDDSLFDRPIFDEVVAFWQHKFSSQSDFPLTGCSEDVSIRKPPAMLPWCRNVKLGLKKRAAGRGESQTSVGLPSAGFSLPTLTTSPDLVVRCSRLPCGSGRKATCPRVQNEREVFVKVMAVLR